MWGTSIECLPHPLKLKTTLVSTSGLTFEIAQIAGPIAGAAASMVQDSLGSQGFIKGQRKKLALTNARALLQVVTLKSCWLWMR